MNTPLRYLSYVLGGIGIGLAILAGIIYGVRTYKEYQVLNDAKQSWIQQTNKDASSIRKKAERIQRLYERADTPVTGPGDPNEYKGSPDTYAVSSTPSPDGTEAVCRFLGEVLRTAPGPPARLHCYRDEAYKGDNPVHGRYFPRTRTIALYDVEGVLSRQLMKTFFHEFFHHLSHTGEVRNYASVSVVAEEMEARLYARKQYAEWKQYCFKRDNHNRRGCL